MHIPDGSFQIKVLFVYHGNQQGPSALGLQGYLVVRTSEHVSGDVNYTVINVLQS